MSKKDINYASTLRLSTPNTGEYRLVAVILHGFRGSFLTEIHSERRVVPVSAEILGHFKASCVILKPCTLKGRSRCHTRFQKKHRAA